MSNLEKSICHHMWQVLVLTIFLTVYATGQGTGWTRKEIKGTSHKSFSSSSPNIRTILATIATTKDGILRGFLMQTLKGRQISAFQGIQYGQAPVGHLRFKVPQKSRPWDGIRDALAPGPDCLQLDSMPPRGIHGQEDCLYLNVYVPQVRPRNERKLPVMLYLHGGSFVDGSGSVYGPSYLLDQDIILVTINYRLGPLGFLSTGDLSSPGNFGLWDQVLALKWVQANIEAFNGDRNSVTIFGQSAGGGAVSHHIVSPASRGLFHKGISQSGSGMCWWAISENSPELARRLGALFNCTGSSQTMVECLRNVDATDLVAAQQDLKDWNAFPIVNFGPVVEHKHPGAFLTDLPHNLYKDNKAAKVPWMTGFARYEMSWLLADFIQNPSAVAELNLNWDELGKIFLTVRNATGDNSRIATRIRDFYLGRDNEEIGFRNRDGIAQMLGDRFFLECGLDGMRLHSRYTDQPVYGYEVSFEGKYSIVQLYGQDPQEWGVAHLDDSLLLLNNTRFYPTIQPEDVDEVRMSEIITSAWANFATYGKPYINSGTRMSDIWEPIQRSTNALSPINFLDLSLKPRMVGNPYEERYAFWKSLQLTE